ncbi:MAG: anti-sigma factor [Pyrinomonadaceae bacterium]
MNNSTDEQLLELLLDDALFDTDQTSEGFGKDLENQYEVAAAELFLLNEDPEDSIPDSLLARLELSADRFHEERAVVEVAEPEPAVESAPAFGGWFQWTGWAVAAACAILAFGIWNTKPREVYVDKQPKPEVALTLEQKRDSLVSAGDTIKATWTSPQNDKALAGEVVWNDRKQEGYMTFKGLAANDIAREEYQLWIFDETQDEKTPVDGGVFDVDSSGEVIIPINAKLKVKGPKAFAVTVEKPGGVVVSKREKIVALAKV